MYGRKVITAIGEIAGDVGVLGGVTETVVPVHYDLRNDLDAAQEGRQWLYKYRSRKVRNSASNTVRATQTYNPLSFAYRFQVMCNIGDHVSQFRSMCFVSQSFVFSQ